MFILFIDRTDTNLHRVHIIYGCSVPVVLRQHLDSTQWKVVGDCYVDNIMDGQALRDNSLAEETITLI